MDDFNNGHYKTMIVDDDEDVINNVDIVPELSELKKCHKYLFELNSMIKTYEEQLLDLKEENLSLRNVIETISPHQNFKKLVGENRILSKTVSIYESKIKDLESENNNLFV